MNQSEPAAAPMTLRERKKAQVREQILASAERLIQTQGFEETTMRQIAAAAELSYQTLYNYFPTKGDILLQLLGRRVRDLHDDYASLLQSFENNLLAALDELTRQALDLLMGEDRTLWRIAMVEMLNQAQGSTQVLDLIDTLFRRVLEDLLESARRTGELSPAVSIPMLAGTLFDLMDYATTRLLLDPTADALQARKNLSARYALVVSPYVAANEQPL